MFTGLIEETGSLLKKTPFSGGLRLAVSCSASFSSGVKVGDSVSVNGCCLTAVSISETLTTFEAVAETVSKSNISAQKLGSQINLERALKIGDRLGGHFVQGHVDGVAEFVSQINNGMEWRLSFKLPENLSSQCISKGSITISGISLTIAKLEGNLVEVAVIPHTRTATNLQHLSSGDLVNIETDMIGKWVAKILSHSSPQKSNINETFLRDHGFM